MKRLFFGLIGGCLIISACNQKAPASGAPTSDASTALNAPVMKFDKETYDFGKIKQGAKVTYDFKFTNTGKSPLIITNAVATCGCTTPTYPKTPVKPGEGGIIHVVFDSSGKQGLQDKMVTITANTNPAQSREHLIGEVLTK
jgi:hypothetical protein